MPGRASLFNPLGDNTHLPGASRAAVPDAQRVPAVAPVAQGQPVNYAPTQRARIGFEASMGVGVP
jgi:hypothetical protein